MTAHLLRFSLLLLVMTICLACEVNVAQEPPLSRPAVDSSSLPAAPTPSDAPPVPDGVEVLARGPVHEAYASPTVEPKPTPPIPRQPPEALEEMPPEERPQGESVWISGYWAWDDERENFLWVSGCWRTPPPGKEWIAGYWRAQGGQWQWVSGFWTNAAREEAQASEVQYYPEPPPPPAMAAPGEPPNAESFHVPGHWVWRGDRYLWQAGYWARFQPGYVWVPAHYRWTPFGHVYVAGYWDLTVTRRGVLYAPVTVDVVVVGPRFVYTPCYAVCDSILFDSFFVRPARCHYYFGDYYGPTYHRMGFESCVVYSRRSYDAVFAYHRWEHRHNPSWLTIQLNLFADRDAGRAPRPPRTLVQQNTIIRQRVTNVTNVNNVTNVYNTQVIAPTKVVTAARGQKTEKVDVETRASAKKAARHAQLTAIQQRQQTETASSGGGALKKPHVASMKLAPATVQRSGDGRKKHADDHKQAAKNAPKIITGQPLTGPAKDHPGKDRESHSIKQKIVPAKGKSQNSSSGPGKEQNNGSTFQRPFGGNAPSQPQLRPGQNGPGKGPMPLPKKSRPNDEKKKKQRDR